MTIRTIIVATVASLSMTTMSLGDWFTELTASGGASYDYFGGSVAIDGDTCVVGAPNTNSFTGSAYVFTNTGGTWSQVAELTATDATDQFGISVAIDGDTCVIGASGTNSFTGSAYVFTNTGGTWSQVAELTATDGASNDYFGGSVAIDGDTCVIGATDPVGTGSAYVFTNTGGTWSQVAELTATGGASGDQFGASVDLDGDTCVIGAWYANSYTGSAFVFTNTGGTWSQVAELTAPGGASNDFFGNSVAIDGNTCVIGAYGTNFSTGSAHVFTNTGGTWSQVAELTAPGGASNDYFGNSVSIDGDTCVIGAPGINSNTGSAYVFTNTGGTWGQVAELTGSTAGDAFFSGSVAISGSTCVIGAYGTNFSTGSAYVYGSSSGQTGIAGDLDGDGDVDTDDLDIMHANLTICPSDTDHDGDTDIEDLLDVIAGWGTTCP